MPKLKYLSLSGLLLSFLTTAFCHVAKLSFARVINIFSLSLILQLLFSLKQGNTYDNYHLLKHHLVFYYKHLLTPEDFLHEIDIS